MRPRLFLRTAEFLWQEGHTAHATKEEALEETKLINGLYADFAENFMAIPVVQGVKSESERFAGAEETYCIEALMQDGKALQAGTSHFLGQNFAKAFDVKFATKSGVLEHVWASSWGVSTRLMGAIIMTHSDDNGLILPPNLAPIQVVIVPIYRGFEQLKAISKIANKITKQLTDAGISVKYDDRDNFKPGYKFNHYELKGVPLRISIGPRDLENNVVELVRRDTLEKNNLPIEGLIQQIQTILDQIQTDLFSKALRFREEHITTVNNFEEFQSILSEKGGFIYAHWDGTSKTEEAIKNLTKATIRCIPFEETPTSGKCIYSGKPSSQRVLFAKAY